MTTLHKFAHRATTDSKLVSLSFGMTTSGDKWEVFNAFLRTSEQVSCVKEAAKINEGRVPSFRACNCQT